MSRSVRVQVRSFTREDLKRFGLSLLETEVNHNKMMGQKMEVKRFGSVGILGPAPSFGQFLGGFGSGQLPGIACGSGILTDQQRAVLESLGNAARILHRKAEVRLLPSMGEAIPIEFFIPAKEREKVPVRPIRPIGGKYEA